MKQALLAALVAAGACAPAPPVVDLPADQLGLRYRIEMLREGNWVPVQEDRSFKKDDTIRFRFMSNVTGTLYLLNTGEERGSLRPALPGRSGADWGTHLGQGTRISANEVGLFPDQARGGGLRFTGRKGMERFLFVYVPEGGGARDLQAVPSGAESWLFDDGRTYTVTADRGQSLFHYFELKSR